jgi:hypothetical protein
MYVRRILATLERRKAEPKAGSATTDEPERQAEENREVEQVLDVPEGEIPF